MSKRQAEAFEMKLEEAKKKRIELDQECSSLRRVLAALRKKAATAEAANELHIEQAEENRFFLLECQKDVRQWRMRAGHQSGIIEGLESETRELKSHNEKLRSAYRKLNSDYERLRQCGAEVVGLMTGCPIQGGDPGEIKEEMPDDNMLEQKNELDVQDSESKVEHDELMEDEGITAEEEQDEENGYEQEQYAHEQKENAFVCDNRKTIDLAKRRAEAIPNLHRFYNLETLILRSNRLKSISDGLPRTLVSLHLSNNKIEEVRGLDALVNLEDLYLSDNRLRKIEGLTNLVNLKFLTLNDNRISSIEGLDSLRDLRHLDLSNNKIRKIQNTQHLTKLVTLIISNNPIRKLENLGTLTRLTTLWMNEMALESFNGIQKLVNLTTVHANENAITTLGQLGKLRCLKLLSVKDNRIADWSEVEKLASLPSLKTVALTGNPVQTHDLANYRAKMLRAVP